MRVLSRSSRSDSRSGRGDESTNSRRSRTRSRPCGRAGSSSSSTTRTARTRATSSRRPRRSRPRSIEFMITHGRGQLCMPIMPELAERLELHPMVEQNTAPHQTPFTVPVDHVSCRHRHQRRGAGADHPRDHRPGHAAGRPGPARATCSPWWPRRGACSAAPGTPRRPSTWPGWPA